MGSGSQRHAHRARDIGREIVKTPTYKEWIAAYPYQRKEMTWPIEVLRILERERP